MRLPKGYAYKFDPTNGVVHIERDTFTCFHCERINHVEPFAQPDKCPGCWKEICPDCVGKPCDPMEEKVKRYETMLKVVDELERDRAIREFRWR